MDLELELFVLSIFTPHETTGPDGVSRPHLPADRYRVLNDWTATRGPATVGEVVRALLAAPPWRWRPDLETPGWLLVRDRNPVALCASDDRGWPTACAMDFCKILHSARRFGASAVVLVHNHPSGDPTPSAADLACTASAAAALGVFGLQVMDHFVVGADEVASIEGFLAALVTASAEHGAHGEAEELLEDLRARRTSSARVRELQRFGLPRAGAAWAGALAALCGRVRP